MNWKIIFQLSVFGLIMAFATVSLIPFAVEPVFWIIIFVFCAYIIAKVCKGKYFLQGLFLGLVNCVWVTSAHLYFYDSYIAHHQQIALQYAKVQGILSVHPRLVMILMGNFVGFVSALVQGLCALLASIIIKKK